MGVAIQNLVMTQATFHVIRDTDANGTREANVAGGAATLYALQIDNSLNTATSYFKMWDATAPTVGTTAPNWCFMIPGGVTANILIPTGAPFSTGLSFACVTTAGTAGTTNPTSTVSVVLLATW